MKTLQLKFQCNTCHIFQFHIQLSETNFMTVTPVDYVESSSCINICKLCSYIDVYIFYFKLQNLRTSLILYS